MYYSELAYIPKSVLENIRKTNVSNFYKRKKDGGILLVKWKNIVNPEEERGWGFEKYSLLVATGVVSQIF